MRNFLIGTLNFLNLLVSILVIAALLWFHGYQYRVDQMPLHQTFLHLGFIFYLLQFFIRGVLHGDFIQYLRENRFEQLLFMVLVGSMVVNWAMDFSVVRWLLGFSGIENIDLLYILFMHIWLLLIVGLELGKAVPRSTIWKLSPPWLFILSFLVLIVIGSSLLMLPEMTVNQEGMSFVDAIFTSISANCVTGLTVVDTATFFSFKGKVVLLGLIQVGGLNIIAFATFFIMRYHKVITEKHHDRSVRELLHQHSLSGETTWKMLLQVAGTALLIEFIGAWVMYFQWPPDMGFVSHAEMFFYSLFHSVSAFNNAGFSLFTGGFAHESMATQYHIHITIAILIVLGSFGFATLWDLGRHRYIFHRKLPQSPYRLDSRVAIIGSFLLILVGAIVYLWLEQDRSLLGKSGYEGMVTALFQSVTTRTAGFNTVDIGALSLPVLIVMMVWMVIGASSGSTGGGIKTSTVAVLLVAFLRRIRGAKAKANPKLLSQELVEKAIAILVYSIVVIFVGTLLLLVTDPELDLVKVIFEEVSAFGTVGLSMGITSELSSLGKVVVMVTMFIGRIGPLALAYTLIRKMNENREEPSGFMIG